MHLNTSLESVPRSVITGSKGRHIFQAFGTIRNYNRNNLLFPMLRMPASKFMTLGQVSKSNNMNPNLSVFKLFSVLPSECFIEFNIQYPNKGCQHFSESIKLEKLACHNLETAGSCQSKSCQKSKFMCRSLTEVTQFISFSVLLLSNAVYLGLPR